MSNKKYDKMQKSVKKAFSESFMDKLRRHIPILGKDKDEEEVGKGGKKPKATKDYLTKSLKERMGR